MSFDWSEMGYASHLITDEREYIYDRKWEWKLMTIPYGETGVSYTTADDIRAERERIMREEGITDTLLVRVEKLQIPKAEIIFEENKYRAILTYEDTIINVSIDIPEKIKRHLIQIDTIGNYKRKVIKPREGIEGTTGVYFEDLESSFNFNLVGENLSLENQKKAINAFKSIKIKRK